MIKQLLIASVSLFLFLGCGDTTPTTKNGTIDDNNTQVDNTPVFDNTIQELLYSAQNGTVENVTYICIGDSTRARSEDDRAHLLFDRVALALEDYNVTSHLLARGNHTLDDFIHGDVSPTWAETANLIPNEGETTIVDISLGVNDFFALNISSNAQFAGATQAIKDKLIEAINMIKSQKPQTTFLLTAPNPSKVWEQATQIYLKAYKEVANENDYIFINFIDDIMPAYNEVGFSDWYRENNEIHFSVYGLYKVADYILLNILPKEE